MEFKDKIMLHDFREVKYRWEVGEVGRWERWKGNEVARWEGGRFLVLFKGGEHRVSPRFYLFVSDINQGNKGAVRCQSREQRGWVEDSSCRDGKTP